MATSKRNIEIDILRFIFAFLISSIHFGTNSCFLYADICVEFFFIVSGYLLAKKVLKSEKEIDSAVVIKKKLFSFYWLLVICVLMYIFFRLITGSDVNISEEIVDLFLLNGFGFKGAISPFWYLSSMMISTVLILPVLKKIKSRNQLSKDMIYILAFTLFLYSILYSNTGRLIRVGYEFIGFVLSRNIRGLADMLLGVLSFSVVQWLNEKNFNKYQKVLYAFVNIAAYVLFWNYLQHGSHDVRQFGGLICLDIIVICAFAREKYLPDIQPGSIRHKVTETIYKISGHLGKLSLPIYLFHQAFYVLSTPFFSAINANLRFALLFAMTLAFSDMVLRLRGIFDVAVENHRKKQSGNTSVVSIKKAKPVTAAISVVLFAALSIFAANNTSHPFFVLYNNTSYDSRSSVLNCYPDMVVSEDFYVENTTKLNQIVFRPVTWLNKYESDQETIITIRSKDDQSTIYSSTVKMSEFKDQFPYYAVPDEEVILLEDTWYNIEFASNNGSSQNIVGLLMTKDSDNKNGATYINGQKTDEHLAVQIYGSKPPADMVSSTLINNSLSYEDKSSTVSCYTSTVVSEDFQVENTSKLAEIKFYTITWNKSFADDQQMKVIIRNKDTNEEVYTETHKISEFQDGKAFSLIPDENVVLTGSSRYTIEFVPTTREEQEYMALMMTNVTNNAGKAYLNGEETDEHISMKIITQEL